MLSSNVSRKKIIFIASTVAQVETFLPVIAALKERGWTNLKVVSTECTYSSSNTVMRHLVGNNVPCESLSLAMGPLKELGVVRRWTQGWRCLSSRISDYLSNVRLSIVVLGNDSNPVEGLFIKHATTNGVPTLLVQDGVILSRSHRFGVRARGRLGKVRRHLRGRMYQLAYLLGCMGRSLQYGHGGCTRIAVYGPFTRRELTKTGIDPRQIVVTGQPRYDQMISAISPVGKWVKKGQTGRGGAQTISVLFAAELTGKYLGSEQVDEGLMESLKELAYLSPTQYRIVIKPHPFESVADYARYLGTEEAGFFAIRDPESSIQECLMNADVVISRCFSTVIFEAMILRKPLILLGCDGHPLKDAFVQSGSALVASDGPQLIAAMQSVQLDPDSRDRMAVAQQRFLLDHINRLDGRASGRVATLIESMIEDDSVAS